MFSFGIILSMDNLIPEQELKRIKNIQGEIRGAGITEPMSFILKKEGGSSLKKLEQSLAKMDFPMKLKKINTTQFYPLSWGVVVQVAIKELFDYKEEDFVKMGKYNARVSFILKLFMKYLVSLDMVAKAAQTMWRKYNSIGTLKVVDYSYKERYGIVRIEDFPVHPILCPIYKGYLSSIVSLVVGKETSAEETKCVHRGDEYCEFVISW